MVELLPPERWNEIEDILAREFEGSHLPAREGANILVKLDNKGRIKGFCIAETLIRVGQFYTAKSEAGENMQLEFTRFLVRNMPEGASVIAISSDARFDSLCEKFAMRRVVGTVYRRDF